MDDEPGVRISLSDLIDGIGYAITAFDSGHDLLVSLATLEPGCILLDVQMPAMSGFEVLEELARRGVRWPVIAMTGHGDVPMAVTAMKLGAIDFIEKPFSPVGLKQMLDRVREAWSQQRQRHRDHEQARIRLSTLTAREQDILACLAKGKQNKSVAFDLNLSIRTVEMHRANMLTKLGLRTIQEAVLLVAIANFPNT